MQHPVRGVPCHRSILIVDIEGSTQRTDPTKGHLRSSMYRLLERALRAAGLAEDCFEELIDRGDGILALIRPVDQAPKTVLLSTVVPALGTLLTEHNARHPEHRFRLRVVVHAGEVVFDDKGCFGEALDIAFRLLDAEPVKRALRATVAPMVLVVSDDVYQSVIRHGYDGIDPRAFDPLLMPPSSSPARTGWLRTIEASRTLPSLPDKTVARMDDYRRRA